MRVKMLSNLAGPNGCAHIGQTVELDDELAQRLIDGGYAVIPTAPSKKAKGAVPARKESDDSAETPPSGTDLTVKALQEELGFDNFQTFKAHLATFGFKPSKGADLVPDDIAAKVRQAKAS